MRLYGKNRASAPWFLNQVNERRPAGWSSSWTSERFTPASSPQWNTRSMRPDEFHPCRRLEGGSRIEHHIPGLLKPERRGRTPKGQ